MRLRPSPPQATTIQWMVFRLNHGVAAVRQEAKPSTWPLPLHNRRKDNELKRMR
jgi:hypothetical protein